MSVPAEGRVEIIRRSNDEGKEIVLNERANSLLGFIGFRLDSNYWLYEHSYGCRGW